MSFSRDEPAVLRLGWTFEDVIEIWGIEMLKDDAATHAVGRCLLGRLRDLDGGRPGLATEVVVYDRERREELCRVGTDDGGRFLARFDDDIAAGSVLDLVVYAEATGDDLARHRVTVPGAGGVFEAEFTIGHSKTAGQRRRRLEKLPPSKRVPSDLVLGSWRIAIAQLLRHRQPEKNGVPVVPARINWQISQLYELRDVALRILRGDLRPTEHFEQLIGLDRKGFDNRSGLPSAGGGAAPDHIAGFAERMAGSGPCIFDDRGAIEVGLAGLYLDAYRAESLGDLTQPGAYAVQSARHLHRAHGELTSFTQAVSDLAEGRMSPATYEKIVYGPPGSGDPEPLDLPGDRDGFGGPARSFAPGLGPDQPPSRLDPGGPLPPGGGPCLDIWVDCVDEISAFASGYQPPTVCSPEETIAGISPQALCDGEEDVELTIRSVHGEGFRGDPASCRVVLQRGLKRTQLTILSFSDDEVRVRLDKATRSGCIGFVGSNGGSSGANPALIRSCMRAAGIHNRALDGLLTPGNASLRAIQCLPSGANQLSVVGEPRIQSLGASWSGGNTETPFGGSVTLVAEACRDVTLEWDVDFGPEAEDWLDPDDFISVEVKESNGTVIASGRSSDSSVVVNETQPETYTITATASVGGSTCGTATGSIVVERYHALRLSGIEQLQTGSTANLSLSSSCPAPAGGVSVTVGASPSNRLNVDSPVVIPAGASMTAFSVTATGTGCQQVTVSVDAAGHLADDHVIEVFDAPALTSVTPPSLAACETIDVEFSGSCFAADEVSVRATRFDGVVVVLEVLQVTPTSVTARATNLRPGSYDFVVRSRGLNSNIVTVNAIAGPPVVDLFIADLVGQLIDDTIEVSDEFIPCAANVIEVTYSVSNTTRVRLTLDGDTLEDIVSSSTCGETLSSQFPIIESEGGTLRLDAFRVNGGNPLTEEQVIGGKGAKKLDLHNSTTLELVIWNISGLYQDARDIPHDIPKQDLAPNGDVEVTFSDCVFHHVVAVDKQAAIDADRDPYGDAIEVASLRQWESVYVGDTDGDDESATLTF